MKVLLSLLALSSLTFAQVNKEKPKFSSKKIKTKILDLTEDFNVNKLTFNQIENLSMFQVLDTRTKEEFAVSHLNSAQFIDYDDYDLEQIIKKLDKNKPVLVYCSIGYRSGKISMKLKKKGFKVYNLLGGIFEWVNNDKPVFRNEKKTLKVHGYNKDWGKWVTKGKVVY